MRTIGIVTVARSDYGIYRPILEKICQEPELRSYIYASGMHLSPAYGYTVQEIEADGFEINERIESLLSSDSPEGIAKSMAMGIAGFAQSFGRYKPDLLLVLGDRFEMFCAVVAALPFNIPIAHIHGGETTTGAIDEAFRHAMTKMSHFHFVAMEAYAQRIIRMGEVPDRVVVSGAPGLDNLHRLDLMEPKQLSERLGLRPNKRFLLVTYHPVTLMYESTNEQVTELLTALAETDLPIVLTYPNADTASRSIIKRFKTFAVGREQTVFVTSLGTLTYFSAMSQAAAMVGNSSSGIIEAASFKLPVVNIGLRQDGRLHGKNVINVECDRQSIVAGIQKATSQNFSDSLHDLVNPYGDGDSAKRIVEHLQTIHLDEHLLLKRFHDPELSSSLC